MEVLYNTQYSQPLSALLRGQLINLGSDHFAGSFLVAQALVMQGGVGAGG